MVTLSELQARASRYKHLDTGIPGLQINFNNTIYDFQSTPGDTGVHPVLANLVVSHLKADESHRAIVVQTQNPFPWLWLKKHPSYDKKWESDRIRFFVVETFAELYWLFCSDTLSSLHYSNSILVVANFHELAQLYKLQLSTACEEALLKFHIFRNAAAIAQQKHLPELPSNSGLLRENPLLKFQAHVSALTSLVSQFAFSTDLICILTGFLITKSVPYAQDALEFPRSSQSVVSDNTQMSVASQNFPIPTSQNFRRQSRPVLVPSLNDSDNSAHVKSAFSNYIAARLVFYKDWYHLSPQLQQNSSKPGDKKGLRLVNVVECKVPSTAATSKIYFDYENDEGSRYNFSGLSSPDLLQWNSHPPSSPEISESQLRTLLPEFSLEIEASDEEPSLLQPTADVLHGSTSNDTSVHQISDEQR